MSTLTYKCPCCGAPLNYGGASGKLECASCGNSFDLDAIQALNDDKGKGSVEFARPTASYSGQDAQVMRAYICQNCGAELVTDENTTATECAYCGSPAVLPGKIESGVRPEKVIPFRITKEQAVKTFEDYFHGKRLIPNVFLESRNRISEMRKLYVPYWLFDCGAEGDIVYDAEKSRTTREGDWEVTRTQHFMLRRRGHMAFANIPVDGSEKLDDRITESVEPFDMSDAVAFQPAVLSGALADNADVDAAACEARAIERVTHSVENALRDTVRGYENVHVRRSRVDSYDGKVTPVLMPVWIITTEKVEKGAKKIYTFAINGQTGALTCDVPYAKGKAAAWFFGLFLGISAVGCGALALLNALGVL